VTSRNRFLVIVRAGDRSLHPAWTDSLATRDWDLAVSYFGGDPDRYRDAGAQRFDDPGQKWHGLHALLTRENFWRDYDYICLPDDDLATDQAAISTLFSLTASYDLTLTQPALSWQSYFSHPVTLLHPSFKLRRTGFVEIMAPCFRRSALEACLATFLETYSGWGLNWVWPGLLPDNITNIAVIDDAVITHTRPIGGPNYDKLRELGISAHAEGRKLRRKYGVSGQLKNHVLRAVDQRGVLLDAAIPADAALLAEYFRRDALAFQAWRQRQDPSVVAPLTQFQNLGNADAAKL
jgi:Protein of unknown function (DUF707)